MLSLFQKIFTKATDILSVISTNFLNYNKIGF